MPPQFCRSFRVRSYECDALGHVNNAVYLQYLQEAAMEASAAAGCPISWYATRGEAWVARDIAIGYLSSGAFLDAHARPVRLPEAMLAALLGGKEPKS